jgi:hypothetical protein
VTTWVTQPFSKIRVCKALKVTPPGDRYATPGLAKQWFILPATGECVPYRKSSPELCPMSRGDPFFLSRPIVNSVGTTDTTPAVDFLTTIP